MVARGSFANYEHVLGGFVMMTEYNKDYERLCRDSFRISRGDGSCIRRL